MQSSHQLTLAEAVLKSLLSELGPKGFAVALHNASQHGDCFKENFSDFLDENDDNLSIWYGGIEMMLDIASHPVK